MITKEELIGQRIEITYNDRKFYGIVIDETKNMITLEMKEKIVKLPKSQSLLKVKNVMIEGKAIAKRPEDRIKAC